MAVSVFRFSAAQVRWSQAELDQLQSLWIRAYKRAQEEGPWIGGGAKGGAAEKPARVTGASAAGREGTRRSEKAQVSEEALLTVGSKAKKPVNA